jgi:hypothetical protein
MSDLNLNPLDEAFGHLGALELQALELPKMLKLARRGGGLVRLAIERENQRGIDAERELRRVGIPIVNRDFDAANLFLDVETKQSSWAEYVLHRAGFVVTSTPIDPRNATWAAGKGRVPAWSESARALVIRRRDPVRSWLGRLVDWIAGGGK